MPRHRVGDKWGSKMKSPARAILTSLFRGRSRTGHKYLQFCIKYAAQISHSFAREPKRSLPWAWQREAAAAPCIVIQRENALRNGDDRLIQSIKNYNISIHTQLHKIPISLSNNITDKKRLNINFSRIFTFDYDYKQTISLIHDILEIYDILQWKYYLLLIYASVRTRHFLYIFSIYLSLSRIEITARRFRISKECFFSRIVLLLARGSFLSAFTMIPDPKFHSCQSVI